MEQVSSDSGWRGSADGWLQVAYDVLLDSGVDAVKIQPLAQRLNLSRTSFYWFFKDRQALLAGLVARWRDKNTTNLIRQSEAYAETVAEAMLNVFDCWLDTALFDSQFEFAVRSWALQSTEIAEEVKLADRLRLDAMKRMFVRFGHKQTSADVRARSMYLTQIGYISMQQTEDLAQRLARIPDYVEIFTGEVPKSRELDRFFARHQ
jgi:AcrR family transcriptional regulator